ncbi:MAG: hypothetical protein ACYDBW_07840 [Sulfuricaulis sp.]
MDYIKSHHPVLSRHCHDLNEPTPFAQTWMARSRPGIKRHAAERATTMARNRPWRSPDVTITPEITHYPGEKP